MQRIKLMTDSASDLPKEIAQQLGVDVIPIPIAIDGKGYLDGEDFSPREFYSLLADAKEIPTTSQISPLTYCEHYYEAYKEGYTDVIMVSISSHASSTYLRSNDGAQIFFENCPEAKDKFHIHTIDSLSYSLGYGCAVMKGAVMAQNGSSVEEILDMMHDWIERVVIYFTAFSFEYIKKSGRISCASAIVGEALGIRPLIRIKNGSMEIIAKPRGKQNVLHKMAEHIRDEIAPDSPLVVLNGTEPDAADEISKFAMELADKSISYMGDAGSCISINSGPRMLGIGFLTNKSEK